MRSPRYNAGTMQVRAENRKGMGRNAKLRRLQAVLPDIVNYVRALSQDSETARDIAQETYIRAMTAKTLPDDTAAMRAWGLRVARNIFVDEMRKQRVRMEYARVEERFIDEGKSVTPPQFNTVMVREAFSALSQDHREIMFLVDVLGMSYAEAAEALNVANGTVMSRVSRARAHFIEALESGKIQPIDSARRKKTRG